MPPSGLPEKMTIQWAKAGDPPAQSAGNTDIQSILDALGGGSDPQSMIQLLDLLMGAKQRAKGSPGAAGESAAGLLPEQRARAELQASSLSPEAKFLPTMNPGGLFDTIAAFVGKLGGQAPTVEEAQRTPTRAPLSSDMGDLMEVANTFLGRGFGAEPSTDTGQYDEKINTLLNTLFEQFVPTKPAAPAATPGARAAANVASQKAAPDIQKSIPTIASLFSGLHAPDVTKGRASSANEPPAEASDTSGILDFLGSLFKGGNYDRRTPGKAIRARATQAQTGGQ